MKWYEYVDQDGVHRVSEEYILDFYYEYWADAMTRAGKEDLISKENCIKDFFVVHWVKIPLNSLKQSES